MLLSAMLFAQAYLLIHELEHVLASDNQACELCEMASHQGHALFSSLSLSDIAATALVPKGLAYTFTAPHINYFTSRAPPRYIPS